MDPFSYLAKPREELRPFRHCSLETEANLERIEAIAVALSAWWDHAPDDMSASDEADVEAMADWLQTMPEPLRAQMIDRIRADRRRVHASSDMTIFGRTLRGAGA